MIFSSPVFIMIFLPVFLSVYYSVPSKFRSLIILIGSYIFYGWWRVDFLALFSSLRRGCALACPRRIVRPSVRPSVCLRRSKCLSVARPPGPGGEGGGAMKPPRAPRPCG